MEEIAESIVVGSRVSLISTDIARHLICAATKHFHSIWNMCNTIKEMFLNSTYYFVLKFAEIVSDMLTRFFNSFVYLSSS